MDNEKDAAEYRHWMEVTDPLTRVQMAGSKIEQLRVGMTRWKTRRAQALIELRASGKSAQEIGDALGVTRQQVSRLIREAEGSPSR